MAKKPTNKAYSLDLTQYESLDTTPYCVSLTQQDAIAILSQLPYLLWGTRWAGDTTQDFRNNVVGGIQSKLLAIAEGCGSMTCQDVLDCIDTPEGKDKIINITTNYFNSKFEELMTLINQLGGKQIEPPVGANCDAVRYGAIREAIRNINRAILDALETFEVQTNVAETLDAVANVTILDELSIDAITTYITVMQDSILENYNAVYTQQLEDTMICEIWDMTQNCNITIDDLYNYFYGKLTAPLGIEEILQFMAYFNTASFLNERVVYGAYFAFLGMGKLLNMIMGKGGFLGFNLYSPALDTVFQWLQLGANNPSGDYAIICPNPTGGWSKYWDNRTGTQNWGIYTGGGIPYIEYVASSGYRRRSTQTRGRFVCASPLFSGVVTKVKFVFSRAYLMAVNSATNISIRTGSSLDGTGWTTIEQISGSGGYLESFEYEFATPQSISNARISLSMANGALVDQNPFPADLYLIETTFTGLGSLPVFS